MLGVHKLFFIALGVGATSAMGAAAYFDAAARITASDSGRELIDRGKPGPNATTGLVTKSTRLAFGQLLALEENALDPVALEQFEGSGLQPNAKERLHILAGKVTRRSKRNLMAELEGAVESEDLKRTLVALDRLSLIEPDLRKEIFPVLAGSLAQPEGSRLLAQFRSRTWFPDFIVSASHNPASVNQIAAFLLKHRLTDINARDNALRAVLIGLLAQNAVRPAQEFAIGFGGAQQEDLNSLNWPSQKGGEALLPVEWQFLNPMVSASTTNGDHMQFAVDGDAGRSPIAQKIVALAPGLYEVRSKLSFLTGAKLSVLWKIQCGSVPVRQVADAQSDQSQTDTVITSTFEANEQCRGFRISLYLNSSLDQFQRHSFRISNPELTQLR